MMSVAGKRSHPAMAGCLPQCGAVDINADQRHAGAECVDP
jgi:hypothetical protein